jgi:hypothetical protein
MFRSLFVLMIVLVAVPASAQTIYRWKDARGTLHYTDDPSTAPKGVKVETTEGDELNSVTTSKDEAAAPAKKVAQQQQQQTSVVPVPPPPGGEAYEEAAEVEVESTEQYWRTSFREAREKIRSLEDQIATDEKKLGDPTGAGIAAVNACGGVIGGGRRGGYYGPYPYGYCDAMLAEYQRARERLAENRIGLARAKEDLTELERRAANAAVPLEWRR